jgi:hypothetical protein
VKVSAGSTTKTHGFTASQTAKLKGDALTIARNAFNGIKAGQGPSAAWNAAHPQGLPAVDFQQALLEMRESGIPDWIAVPALGQYYQPGENGRPFLPAGKGDAAAVKAASQFFGSTGLGFGGLGG